MISIGRNALVLGVALTLFGYDEKTDDQNSGIGLANPSAVYCIEQGGEYLIEKEPAGDAGYCQLLDGRKVDAWEYYRASQ